MDEILEIAKLLQENLKEEAQAVIDYTEMIKRVVGSRIDEADKTQVIDTIEEIIGDELNHQMKLGQLYVALTSIEPKGD